MKVFYMDTEVAFIYFVKKPILKRLSSLIFDRGGQYGREKSISQHRNKRIVSEKQEWQDPREGTQTDQLYLSRM